MSLLRDARDRERARRLSRTWAAAAGGRSGLPAPMGGVRQRGVQQGMFTLQLPGAPSGRAGAYVRVPVFAQTWDGPLELGVANRLHGWGDPAVFPAAAYYRFTVELETIGKPVADAGWALHINGEPTGYEGPFTAGGPIGGTIPSLSVNPGDSWTLEGQGVEVASGQVTVELVESVGGAVSLAAETVVVSLFVDDVLVAQESGPTFPPFTSSTVIFGQTSGVPTVASETVYDEVKLVRGSNLLGNSGLESALAGSSTGAGGRPVTVGNWWAYRASSSAVMPARVSSPVHTGAWAGKVTNDAGNGHGAYFYQDLDMTPGDLFWIEAQVRPVSGSTQVLGVGFNWDRSIGAVLAEATVAFGAGATTFSAFGLTGAGPPLPTGEWSHVRLSIEEV